MPKIDACSGSTALVTYPNLGINWDITIIIQPKYYFQKISIIIIRFAEMDPWPTRFVEPK